MNRWTLSVILAVLLLLPIFFVTTPVAAQERPGPPADKILVEVRTSQDVGLGDVAAGRADIFMWGLSPATLERLSPALRENLKLIESRSSFWSYVFNPAGSPELGPGILNTTAGEVHFNPFNIKEVRFAMNFVLNRKYLVDEILLGGGEPMYTPIMAPNPFHDWIDPILEELGFSPEGDLELGKQMVDQALTQVAQQLQGTDYTLEKVPDPESPAGFWWKFSGPGVPGGEEIVTVNFIVRVEDERREGGYAFANWIEQTGIKVNVLETERRKAISTVYLTNPRDYLWSIYTEGWISLSDYPYVEGDAVFFYSSIFGFVPAYPIADWIVYNNTEINDIALRFVQGTVTTPEEYRELLVDLIRLGLEDSVRIFAVTTYEYWATSRRATNIVPGFVTGPANPWFYRTVTTPDGIVRLLEFSAQGQLFLTVWNPVLGFTGYYAEIIRMAARDYGLFPHPRTGEPIGVRASFTVEKNFTVEGGQLIGQIEVPSDALVFDPVAEQWVEVGGGNKSISKIVYNFKFSNFHHGIPMTIADVMTSLAFTYEWASQDFEGDPFYDSSIDASSTPYLQTIKGVKVINDTAIEVYADYFHPYSDGTIAWNYDFFTDLPVEIWAAMEYLVVSDGPSTGTNYYWEDVENEVGLDLISPTHAQDMAAALAALRTEGWTVEVGGSVVRSGGAPYVPPYAAPWVTPDEMAQRYQAAENFINTYGHAYISNGPFFISQYRPEERFMELDAFRDPTYPFTEREFIGKFSVAQLVIDNVELVSPPYVGEDIIIDVYVTYIETFPQEISLPATEGTITVTLMTLDGREVFTATGTLIEPGRFQVIIQGAATRGLEPGPYILKIFASLGGVWGWREERSIVLEPNPIETEISDVRERIDSLAQELAGFSQNVADALQSLSDALGSIDNTLGNLQDTLNNINSRLDTQAQEIGDVKSSVDEVSQALGQLSTIIALVGVTLVLQLVAIALMFRRK